MQPYLHKYFIYFMKSLSYYKNIIGRWASAPKKKYCYTKSKLVCQNIQKIVVNLVLFSIALIHLLLLFNNIHNVITFKGHRNYAFNK